MLSQFFLERPVFAWVIAIIIMLMGAIGVYKLPISQYPPIAPPSISIDSYYPGASAETVEASVTQIIEQKMTGFEKMLYISAQSSSAGTSRIELTFAAGTDPDLAWAQVQNKLQLAMAGLPESVQRTGVKVSKSTRNYLIIVGLISEDGSMDGNDLRDYAQSNLESVLSRVSGVGEVESFGTQYAMRIWLNPTKLADYRISIDDVTAAIQSYNVEVSAGQLGGAPAVWGQRMNATITVQNMLKTPEEFGKIPIRSNPDGSVVMVKDVARTEMGTEIYDVQAFSNGRPSAGLAIRQAAGANALNTADNVRAKMEELSRYFPEGMKVVYPYDTTPFVRVAIKEVVKTLFEAILLVFLVMFLFLGSFRATLIPTIAVPVVLLGNFAVLNFFGFSINMLTMFAMVLAIGLLVDDAIVVVENVERIIREEGLSPKEATAKSMSQITSALIGIGLVLSAVFGPMAFFGGSTGVIYRQFSVTIISSMVLSVLVALILTPVLCASLLRPIKEHDVEGGSGAFFRWFNTRFYKLRGRYLKVVEHSLIKKAYYFGAYLLLLCLIGILYLRLPTAYVPDEDQGILLVQAMLPPNSTLEVTEEVTSRIRDHFLTNEPETVDTVMNVNGISFAGRGQDQGMAFVRLKDWELRNKKEQKVDALARRSMRYVSQFSDALIFAFQPPPVVELGMGKGFDFQLQDRGGLGHAKLMEARNMLLGMAMTNPKLKNVRPNGMEDLPQYRVDIDWEKAGALGVPVRSINSTISAAFGSAYVNNFIQGGRVKRVYIQADAPFRMLPKDVERLYVRNTAGKMVPFTSFSSGRWTSGSPKMERFNGFPSINIQGEPADGVSSGEAMKVMEELVSRLPQGIGFDWTGLSYQERIATSQSSVLYFFSVLVIFLCVAALYESWTIPFVNMLMLPLGVFGAVMATTLRGLHNDVYFQIGFLTTLGLSTKNAILIIQFIKEQQRQNVELVQATLNALRIRFRPVIMTSLAFFFGTLPLALASGAGAGAMNAIGTAVTGGLVSATLIDLIFIPLFFIIVSKWFSKEKHSPVEPTRASVLPTGPAGGLK